MMLVKDFVFRVECWTDGITRKKKAAICLNGRDEIVVNDDSLTGLEAQIEKNIIEMLRGRNRYPLEQFYDEKIERWNHQLMFDDDISDEKIEEFYDNIR